MDIEGTLFLGMILKMLAFYIVPNVICNIQRELVNIEYYYIVIVKCLKSVNYYDPMKYNIVDTMTQVNINLPC